MGHRPEVLEAWENLRAALLGPSSTLPLQLKEEVRRTLAQQTGCRFCASLGQPSPDHATRRESLAVAFADAVGSDHTAISDAQVQVLFDEFTTPEIVELLIWISFEYAGQLFGSLIADEPATEEEKHADEEEGEDLCSGLVAGGRLVQVVTHQGLALSEP